MAAIRQSIDKKDSIKGKVAIVGAADTVVGKVPQFSATQLCIDAALRALADAGIDKNQVDGLVTCNSMAEPHMYHAEAMAEYLQIFPNYCVSAGAGGATTFAVVHQAAMAIAHGVCDTVVISMAEYERLRSGNVQAFIDLRNEAAARAAANGLTQERC